MLHEQGVNVDHSTIYRWVQKCAPEMEKRLKWHRRPKLGISWQVAETYVKVKGKWVYLYRAIGKEGNTVDFYLSTRRNAKSAYRFLSKALKGLKEWQKPPTFNTDKAPSFIKATKRLKKEGKCSSNLYHRRVKYMNNRIEADHGKLKRLINPVRGFKSLKTARTQSEGQALHQSRGLR